VAPIVNGGSGFVPIVAGVRLSLTSAAAVFVRAPCENALMNRGMLDRCPGTGWQKLAMSLLVGVVMPASGCDPATLPSDPDLLADLETLRAGDDAVVRLYDAPIPGLTSIASHLWFVVKPAGSTTFDRWELWISPADPYGYVRQNLFGLTASLGVEPVSLAAELIGPEAEPVVEFIQSQSPLYPCAHAYRFPTGPNSSTYIQWVLDNTGWNVTLPPTGIGTDPQLLSLCQ
jgi:hypothetical protein